MLAFRSRPERRRGGARTRSLEREGVAQPRGDPRRPAVRGRSTPSTASRPDRAGAHGPRASCSRASARCARPPAGSAPTHSLRLSFHEARCALEAVRLQQRRRARGRLLQDLGAFQLLLSLQDDDALISYCRSVLGRSRRARATTATSCCARWTSSSSTTGTGRGPRARCTATATRCATGSAASSS